MQPQVPIELVRFVIGIPEDSDGHSTYVERCGGGEGIASGGGRRGVGGDTQTARSQSRAKRRGAKPCGGTSDAGQSAAAPGGPSAGGLIAAHDARGNGNIDCGDTAHGRRTVSVGQCE